MNIIAIWLVLVGTKSGLVVMCKILGVIILRNGMECSVALLSGMEQLFNISLHKNSFVWDCGVIYAATELHIHSLHLIFYVDFNGKCFNR